MNGNEKTLVITFVLALLIGILLGVFIASQGVSNYVCVQYGYDGGYWNHEGIHCKTNIEPVLLWEKIE